MGQLHSEVVSITLSLFLSRCVFVVFQPCIPGEAMADRIVAGDDEHSKLRELQELLHRAQEVEQSLQQQVIRPKAKAKSMAMGAGDQFGHDTATMMGYELVNAEVGTGAMTDASKRLHDDALGDSNVATVAANVNEPAPMMMNRVRRSLMPVNSEAVGGVAPTPEQFTGRQAVGSKAASAGVPLQATTAAEALRHANPSISLAEARNRYPSIPLDGYGSSSSRLASGSNSSRVVLIDDNDRGLPVYTHREPPAGPVRELWHIEHPINDSVPLPEGVTSLEQWSQTTITMQKYAGRTFGQLLDAIKSGDRDVIQYSSWLVHSYSRHITRHPRSQAPDLSAFLLRSGFDPDERASSISYTRTYGSYRAA